MPRVENAKQGVKYILRFVRPLLWMVGAWPVPASSTSYKILQWSIRFVSCVALSFFVVPSILYTLLKVRSGRVRLKLVPPLTNCLSQIAKYAVFLYHSGEFQKMLDHIKEDWVSASEKNRRILATKAKVGHKIVLLLGIFIYTGGLCYRIVLPLAKGRILLPDNTTIRVLPCPGYFGFINEQATPNYEIIFAVQIFVGFIIYTLVCGTVSVFTLLTLHTASLLKILTDKMTELSEQLEVSGKSVQEKITEIVRYHMRIKEFSNDVERITQYLYSIEIANGTCNACMVGYCLIVEWQDSNTFAIATYFMLQISFIICVFTVCYIGQLLLDESNNVRQASITMNWHRFPTKESRCLVLIINMCNHPFKLRAAKTIDITLATFTDIMKMSMAYLNMFREVVQ